MEDERVPLCEEGGWDWLLALDSSEGGWEAELMGGLVSGLLRPLF